MLNTVLFSLEKVLHPVEVTLDLNIEQSEVIGKLLLKLFSNVWQHHIIDSVQYSVQVRSL